MLFDLAHSFVNIFAGGLSDSKTIIFFFYLLILVIIFFGLKNYQFKALKWKWFGLSLGLMYLYGLALNIVFTVCNNLPITKFFIVGGNGEVSASHLWHIHITKAFVAQILTYFGEIKFQTMDAGGAYLGTFPALVFLLGTLLLTILILQSLLYFATSFKGFLKGKNRRQTVCLIIAYAIVSFSVVKTSIDGGIFNHGLWINILFIVLFILQENKKLANYHYYIISFLGLILSLPPFVLYGEMFVALLLFYNAILYSIQRKINILVSILLFLLFFISWWIYGAKDITNYKYSMTILPVDAKVYIYNETTRDVQIIKNKKIQTIGQLAKSLNKNTNYLPIMADEINCKAGKPKISFSVTLISNTPLTKSYFANSKNIVIINGTSLALGNKWQTRLYVFLNPCLEETLSILNGELIKNNINNYFLLDTMDISKIITP